jgi:arsenical-resistance protein 2
MTSNPETQFPPPQTVAPRINKEQLLRQFAVLGDILNAGTLMVDLRRNDFEGGTIHGSLNLPAETFPLNIPTLYRLCVGDGFAVMSRVVFYCCKF